MLKTGTIYGINGPVIYLKGNTGFRMSEMVYVGEEKLVGEVIALDKDLTTVQVYEETTGLRPGETVTASGSAVSVTLAPGILNNIFDGIERPLERIADSSGGAFITRGVSVDSLDRQKKWPTHITVEKGQYLHGGDIIAEVPETHAITHKCMVPPEIEGVVTDVVSDGDYTIEETLVTLELPDGNSKELTMTQHWPIRVPRPTHHRFPASVPLITGQRIIDTMFPIAKGGTAAIPGGFGTGKTMTQHQIAKWADADIIIYIGCGERGNEMTQVLEEFGELTGGKTDLDSLFGLLYNHALEGDADCGGLLSYNYYSGEPVAGVEEGGRPLFLRAPDARFNLANFMRSHLYASVAVLKLGNDILFGEEQVSVDRITAHGGLFRTRGVGQRILAAALNSPISVMSTAGEGGAWGIALLASYLVNREDGQSLPDFLDEKVFAGCESSQLNPRAEDVAGFNEYMERYRRCLPVEQEAVSL